MWRRKRVLLAAVILVPLVALLVSLRQNELYEGHAEVLLSNQDLASRLSSANDPGVRVDPERVAQTQAELAAEPVVAERVVRKLKSRMSADDLLNESTVSSRPNSDILQFRVTAPTASQAAHAASLYAEEFTKYRRELDTASLERARVEVQRRLADLNRGNALYDRLVEKEQELRTLEALQTSNAFVVRSAADADQIAPKPIRNVALGLVVGLLLGIALALLRDTLDTRIRSTDELTDSLGLTLLGAIQAPSRSLQESKTLQMIENAAAPEAEVFRMIRTNLEFKNIDRRVRVIMITSAVTSEGKSTTLANLAVVLARAGRKVAIVDLDLRRPIVDSFFRVNRRPGLTDVALGYTALSDALASVPLGDKRDGQER